MAHPLDDVKPVLSRRRKRILRFCALGLGAVVALWCLPYAVPLPESLRTAAPASPIITDRHDIPLARLTFPDSYRASPVSWEEIPRDFVHCTLAAEDKRFWKHAGVDWLASLRASWDLLRKREIVSGASTITQQLIKISRPAGDRTVSRKMYEALAALHLERTWSKQEILTAYLNRVDYGNRSIGIREASRFYFQKPLADLSLAECALLSGLPQAPSYLNPIRHPERARQRRTTVLERLRAARWTEDFRVEYALAEPIQLRPLTERRLAPWLVGITPPAHTGGIVASTLDASLQRDLETIVREETHRLTQANLRHASVVVLDNRSAEILALVSSADWKDPRGGQINGAFAPRSPGSTLKPFTYLLAIDQGHRNSVSLIEDIPSPYRTPQGVDLPQNYDRTYCGPVLLRDALACSLNVPAMRELNRLGGPRPLHHLLEQWGITTLGEDPHAHGLGLTIGNAPVRLAELAGAYATLARGGCYLRPHLFAPTEAATAQPSPVSEESCLIIAEILADPVARAPSFPPGGPLDLPFPCAVKTGTSSDFCDNWCVGFTRDFTVAVWAGNFENEPMKGISGIDGAAPIFQRAMRRIHRNHPPRWFDFPQSWSNALIDPRNGLRVNEPSPALRTVLLPEHHLPALARQSDYDDTARAFIGHPFSAWYDSPHNRRRTELALRPQATSILPLRILSPVDGAEFLLDPEIPGSTTKLHPLTEPAGVVKWSCETLRIDGKASNTVIHLAPGTHILQALDTRTDLTRSITVRVRSL